MAKRLRLIVLSMAVLAVPLPVAAQDSGRVEVGASLVNLMVVIPHQGDTSVVVGIPSGGFGLVSPSLYASFFVTRRIAIEPQVGLLLISSGGDTSHVLGFAGQVDYFMNGVATSSPYVFGAAGLDAVSNSDTTPKQFGVGGGYRMRAGDRLVLRIEGRYTHFTDGAGSGIGINFSIGGIFGI